MDRTYDSTLFTPSTICASDDINFDLPKIKSFQITEHASEEKMKCEKHLALNELKTANVTSQDSYFYNESHCANGITIIESFTGSNVVLNSASVEDEIGDLSPLSFRLHLDVTAPFFSKKNQQPLSSTQDDPVSYSSLAHWSLCPTLLAPEKSALFVDQDETRATEDASFRHEEVELMKAKISSSESSEEFEPRKIVSCHFSPIASVVTQSSKSKNFHFGNSQPSTFGIELPCDVCSLNSEALDFVREGTHILACEQNLTYSPLGISVHMTFQQRILSASHCEKSQSCPSSTMDDGCSTSVASLGAFCFSEPRLPRKRNVAFNSI